MDQHAFRPTGSTTFAVTTILHNITHVLDTKPYIRIISIDFLQAFDTICLSTLFDKISLLPLPDYLYNWLINFFTCPSHSTIFSKAVS